MSYTIVWNENKTEGIILSGEDANRDAKKVITGVSCGAYSSLPCESFVVHVLDGYCTIQQVTEIK